jgi:hypothetical protein
MLAPDLQAPASGVEESMKSLLDDYLRAVRATGEVVTLGRLDLDADRAFEAVLQAEEALRLHVKIATGVDPTRVVKHPVAAYMAGALVVVAPSNDDHGVEHLHIIDPRDIVRGG